MPEYAIEMVDITKTFPGVVANDNVTLRVYDREIHALLGENGRGQIDAHVDSLRCVQR